MFYERLKLVLFDTGERAVRRKFPSFLKRGTPNLILARKGETRLAMWLAYHPPVRISCSGYCGTLRIHRTMVNAVQISFVGVLRSHWSNEKQGR